jgi:hypothetical protein
MRQAISNLWPHMIVPEPISVPSPSQCVRPAIRLAAFARPPRLRTCSPSRVLVCILGWRRSSPTHARDARPLRSAMPACNQSSALPFPFPPHVLATCLYSFRKNGRSYHHHQWSRPISHMLFPSLFCTADG